MALKLVYDGGCPFCLDFAQRAELAAGLDDLELCDGRRDHAFRSQLRQRGLSLARGAILIEGDRVWHGSAAIAELCGRMAPGDALLALLQGVFREPRRAERLYPLLLWARRWALRWRGLPEDPDQTRSTPG